VHGLMLAAVNPDNTPHGYNWTFAFPMLLFIVIGAILYALFSRPHRRVPGRPITMVAAHATAASIPASASAEPSTPGASTPGASTPGASEPSGADSAGEAGE
jgi:hypothetical protein